jgi:hypothetical protein
MWPIRIAQAATSVFALGHSLGMLNTQFRDAHERAAIEGLQSYSFDIMGVSRTHWDFYQGMGWSLSLFLVFCVVVMQMCVRIARQQPALARPLLFVQSALFAVMTAFCALWFFPAPLVMSALAAIALAFAGLRLRRG